MNRSKEWWNGFVSGLIWVVNTFCSAEVGKMARHRIDMKIREVENEHGI